VFRQYENVFLHKSLKPGLPAPPAKSIRIHFFLSQNKFSGKDNKIEVGYLQRTLIISKEYILSSQGY